MVLVPSVRRFKTPGGITAVVLVPSVRSYKTPGGISGAGTLS